MRPHHMLGASLLYKAPKCGPLRGWFWVESWGFRCASSERRLLLRRRPSHVGAKCIEDNGAGPGCGMQAIWRLQGCRSGHALHRHVSRPTYIGAANALR